MENLVRSSSEEQYNKMFDKIRKRCPTQAQHDYLVNKVNSKKEHFAYCYILGVTLLISINKVIKVLKQTMQASAEEFLLDVLLNRVNSWWHVLSVLVTLLMKWTEKYSNII